jgi:NADP-dependent 3-hydroxy acid dehydrogenase YdfG
VFAAGRTAERVEAVAKAIRDQGGKATAIPTDTREEDAVAKLFDAATAGGASLDCVIYNAGNNIMKPVRELQVAELEETWRAGPLGGFLVCREAARRMVPQGHGTVIVTGASASLRGRANFAAFAMAKAGLRPQGIHVAHVIIDGGINGERLRTRAPQRVQQVGEDGLLNLDAIADAYMHLLSQHKTAWTHELDLRPYKEPF